MATQELGKLGALRTDDDLASERRGSSLCGRVWEGAVLTSCRFSTSPLNHSCERMVDLSVSDQTRRPHCCLDHTLIGVQFLQDYSMRHEGSK